MQLLKRLIVVGYAFVLIALLITEFRLEYFQSALSISTAIYFWILVGWVYLSVVFKLSSSFTGILALVIFFVGVLLTTLGFAVLGETVLRVSFIGWLIWFPQALLEYLRTRHSE